MHNILCHNCPHPVSAAAAWWAQQQQNHHFQQDHETPPPLHHLEHPQQNCIPNRHQVVPGMAQSSTPRTPTPPDHSHGNNTSNPPTPGNTVGNSMMNSSPQSQYVSITVVGDTADRGNDCNQGVNPNSNNSSYVTYVEGSNGHRNPYSTAPNAQPMTYPVYPGGESPAAVYNSNLNSLQYYSQSSSNSYTQEGGGGGYMNPSTGSNCNNSTGSGDFDGAPNVSHATRVSPATVQWLLDNYETAEGVSLPRYTMYYHYLRHCADYKLEPINAASFGKLIRSVFVGLRTRRLGTRGNSKYHYYGIRLKPSSTLNQLYDDGTPINGPNGYYTVNGRGYGAAGGNGSMENQRQQQPIHNNNNNMGKRFKVVKNEGYDSCSLNALQATDPSVTQQFLGDHTRVLHNFPELDENMEFPEGILRNDVMIFKSLYKEHCKSLLDALVNFQMANVEAYWRTFWRAGGSNLLSDASMEPQNYENLLPKEKLLLLCTLNRVQDFIRKADFHFYQNIVGFLLPNVLQPIPSSMTQAIRNFAKALEGWLASAMTGFPQEIVTIKVSAVACLAQTLRRYTSLNHLAQAARAVLQNPNQISQMITDLNRVDFNHVEEQASWVCGCESDIVSSLEQDFKGTLSQQQSLEQWAAWLESVVDRILRPHMTSPKFLHLTRQFLLKWSYYSSLIIRDLTLRSAASFGSFHLLRLLYDEYMFYLVEHRVAQVTGVVPIAVIGKSDTKPKTEAGLFSDPSCDDIMDVFAHTTDISNVGDMCSANNSSMEGSSPLIQTSTTIAVTSSHQNPNENTYIPSPMKLSPK